jgi:hypothetical protein
MIPEHYKLKPFYAVRTKRELRKNPMARLPSAWSRSSRQQLFDFRVPSGPTASPGGLLCEGSPENLFQNRVPFSPDGQQVQFSVIVTDISATK